MSCTLVSPYYENDSQLQFKDCGEKKQEKSAERIEKPEIGDWGLEILENC
jgi:hypothetical protein